MLKNGGYPYYLKKRILSKRGHLSNDDSGQFAVRLGEAGAKRIVLAHLSKENNTPLLARETVGRTLMRAGATIGPGGDGGDIELITAPADDLGCVYIV
jgi:phosphoribosyl 1,2-cyclic phosphodiesterase